MESPPAILADTNIIIELVRVGAWEKLRAHESVVSVRQCCEEALSGIPGSRGRLPVTEKHLEPPLQVAEVTDAERAALYVACPGAGALDDGERDLLAHAHARVTAGGNPSSAFVIVCADQAAVRGALLRQTQTGEMPQMWFKPDGADAVRVARVHAGT